MDRSSRQKINKETQALNEALDQMDLIDIYRTFHPEATEYTFFSRAHGTFSKIATNQALVTFRKFKSYQAYFLTTMLYDQKSIRKKNAKTEAKQYTTNQPMEIKEEVKKKITRYK